MAEAQALALAPAQAPEEEGAPLDAAAIRSRVEQLSLRWRRGAQEAEEGPAAAEAEAEAARGLASAYKAAQEAMDEWDSSTAAIASDDGDLDAYLERLRKEVALAEEENRKLSDEIGLAGEKTASDTIQLHADIDVLESLLWKLDSKSLSNCKASPFAGLLDSTDSCPNQSIVDKDYMYEDEVLELDQQIGNSEMGVKMFQKLHSVDTMWQLESMLTPLGAKVLDFKDNCLRMFLKAPMLTSDSVIYGQKLDCAIGSFISDHELLIEVDEGNMEPNKVQIFPDDVSVDILIERLKSSREVISCPALEWFIQQCQHHFIINALRRSLVNDANNSRHSFEYFDKEEKIVAHLDRGIDASIQTCADWPLSSYGLKLISIRNSGTHPTNLSSTLLSKSKELANGLELGIRRHLVRFVDAVEEIIVRELQSKLHTGRTSG